MSRPEADLAESPASGESLGASEGGAPPSSASRVPAAVEIYDTTLRDGSQLEGISLSVDDKLRIARQLDRLGVHYIEGGWPGSNPKDDEFFARARDELDLKISTLTAFGSTRRPGGKCETDATLLRLLDAGAEVICIVGKCWDYHVTEALRTTLVEGVAMAADSVAYLVSKGRRVFFDAEHLFDGYKCNPEYSLAVLAAVEAAGAERLVLCDTNGGSLPHEVFDIVSEIGARIRAPLGVHLHNDTGCGVANALEGVRAGAVQVQGTINGYGERTGNCDLVPIIGNLTLKMGVETLPAERLAELTSVSRQVAELVNRSPDPQQPYAGRSAFAHKAGLHASALARRSDAYEHIAPELVGNGSRFVVSEMAGRTSVELKARQLGIEMDAAAVAEAIENLKQLEYEGYHFEVADASLELLLRAAAGWEQSYFRMESMRVEVAQHVGREGEPVLDQCEALLKLWVGEQRRISVGEGNGPVNALYNALVSAVGDYYPALTRIVLTDYKVRVLDTSRGTGAVTRVLIDSTDGVRTWTTIGVSENIVEASWQALVDSLVWGLLHGEAEAEG